MYETILKPDETRERCGLILKDGSIVEVGNVALVPEESYEMDPVAVLPYLTDAIATWHTHPTGNSVLSGADHEGFLLWPDLEHVIISPAGFIRYRVVDGVIEKCV